MTTPRHSIAALVAILALGGPALAQGEVRFGMVLEPPHLDPTAGAAAAIDEILYANVFEGLTRIDANGGVQPSLASEWTISEDGLTYSFTLREGVTFHDGSAFDAEDVVFTFERAMEEGSANAQPLIFEPIESVVADGPLSVTFTLSRPTGDFLFNIGRGDAVIVAPESAETNMTDPVGTGPFRFANWDRGSSVRIERYDDYAGEPVSLDAASFLFIDDPNTALSAMLAGDLDGFPIFPAPESLEIFAADPRFQVLVGTTEGETILALNNRIEPFSDLRVRQAIAHAIDRQAIIDGAMFGYGTPIGTHFAPHHPYALDLIDTYPYDLDAARALLAEAGYPDGFSARLMLPPPVYARRGGQIIAAQLREIGIELELVNIEFAQWLEDVFAGHEFDMTIISHVEPFDIAIYADPNYYFGYDNPDFQAVMTELAATAADADRMALAQEAQRMIAEDAVNVYLFQLAKAGVFDARLSGMWPNAPVEGNDLSQVRWAE